jgi:hypothetical protein
MKLIFHNCAHNGDQYFSQSIVKAIRKYNPNFEIDVVLSCYSFLYSDIKDINIITKPPSEITYHEPYIILDENTLIINTWIGGIGSHSHGNIECCSCRIYNVFKDMYATKFNLPNILDIELLPRTPKTDISTFINWKNTHNSNIVFYNDVSPKSGQTVSSTEHNLIINKLCCLFPEIYFITSEKLCDSKNNISTIHDFKYIQTPDCENLCKNTHIYPHCNLIICFDVGACFNYIEEDVLKSKANILHIAINSYYINSLANNVINTELYSLFLEKCVFSRASNTQDTIEAIINKINITCFEQERVLKE